MYHIIIIIIANAGLNTDRHIGHMGTHSLTPYPKNS